MYHAGEDYNADMSALSFLPGSLSGSVACLNISITDDNTVEGDERFFVYLTVDNPLDTINGDNTTQAEVTIVDNDG